MQGSSAFEPSSRTFEVGSRWAGVLAVLGAMACGRAEPAPPAGSGVEAPIVAPDLPADFTFRWPDDARARVTLRIGEGDKAIAMVSDLTLDAADKDGHRRLHMTPWSDLGGPMAVGAAMLMQRHTEDGLVVQSDGSNPDDSKGLMWTRWVEVWFLFAEAEVGKEKVIEDADLPAGLELRVLHKGVSSLSPRALELSYDLVALDKRGQDALTAMVHLSARTAKKRGAPRFVRFVGHVDPRTLQPLRVDISSCWRVKGTCRG